MHKVSSTLIILTLLFIAGCADNPPEIYQAFWQVNIFNNRENSTTLPQLSLFIQVHDPDGLEDLDEIYLINDKKELFWKLESESWIEVTEDGESWIGSNTLSLPHPSMDFTGEYRLLLMDAGGASAEKVIVINYSPTSFAELNFPEAELSEGVIKLTKGNGSKEYILWIYGNDESFRSAFNIGAGSLAIDGILKAHADLANGFYFFIYQQQKEADFGLISGPFFYSGEEQK
ncbi:hypothetical protein ES707_21943 [subsurface metagenome]